MGETGLSKLIEPVVQELGCELWGIEKLQQGRQVVLKIYIESAEGINVDDCARVSRQVSAILDVEDPIPGEYMFEVSSPWVERRLFKPEHFNVCKGEKVQITLLQAFDGRRKFKGLLCGLEDEEVVIRVDDAQEIVLTMDSIERARVLM